MHTPTATIEEKIAAESAGSIPVSPWKWSIELKRRVKD